MAKHPLWSDEYWLLLMQVYLKKPVGVKPLYSQELVSLALELHIAPQFLYEQMFRLRRLDTPRLEQLWKTYSKSPKRLERMANLLRRMNGYGNSDAFYGDVAINETWEKDFKPIEGLAEDILPVALILILDLYFRLTPTTMVAETPEVVELAKWIRVKPSFITSVMEVYLSIDPYLNRPAVPEGPLTAVCQQIWQRFGDGSPEKLAALAAQMREYYRKKKKAAKRSK